ncbi:MAG: rod-binding protein [Brevinemataceae bacterium]
MNISVSNQASLAIDRSRTHEFSELKNKSLDDNNLKEVAQEFESLFIEMMFKEMNKTIKKSQFSGAGSPGYDIFNDMLQTEYAKETSKTGGFGLASMITESLRRNGN